MRHSFANIRTIFAIVLLIVTEMSTLATSSQAQTAPGMSDLARRKEANRKRMSMYQAQQLDRPVSLPSLPEYRRNGTKFDSGYSLPRLKNVKVYEMHYLAKEPPEKVMSWYREALPGAGWKIIDSQSNKRLLIAEQSQQHLHLQVVVGPPSDCNFQTFLQVTYTSW